MITYFVIVDNVTTVTIKMFLAMVNCYFTSGLLSLTNTYIKPKGYLVGGSKFWEGSIWHYTVFSTLAAKSCWWTLQYLRVMKLSLNHTDAGRAIVEESKSAWRYLRVRVDIVDMCGVRQTRTVNSGSCQRPLTCQTHLINNATADTGQQ